MNFLALTLSPASSNILVGTLLFLLIAYFFLLRFSKAVWRDSKRKDKIIESFIKQYGGNDIDIA